MPIQSFYIILHAGILHFKLSYGHWNFFTYDKPSAWRYQPQQNSSKQINKNNTDFFTQKL